MRPLKRITPGIKIVLDAGILGILNAVNIIAITKYYRRLVIIRSDTQ
jgi:hypothetical protein